MSSIVNLHKSRLSQSLQRGGISPAFLVKTLNLTTVIYETCLKEQYRQFAQIRTVTKLAVRGISPAFLVKMLNLTTVIYAICPKALVFSIKDKARHYRRAFW